MKRGREREVEEVEEGGKRRWQGRARMEMQREIKERGRKGGWEREYEEIRGRGRG